MLVDSNIIIYATQPEYEALRDYLATISIEVSAISRVETLGYSALTEREQQYLEAFFNTVTVLPLDDFVLTQAIHLRRQKRIALGDALIAGTALAYNLALVTRNTQDFLWVDGLEVVDPFAEDSGTD